VRQQIWGEVVDFILAFFQFIWECNSENIIKIGPYLPKLLQEKFGAVFFGPPCISSVLCDFASPRSAPRFKQQTDPRIFGRTRISDQIFLRGGQDLTKSYWIRCIGQGAARTVLGGRLRSLIASVIITFPSRLSWTMSRSELAMPMKAQIWDSNSVAPSLNICSRFFVQPEPYK